VPDLPGCGCSDVAPDRARGEPFPAPLMLLYARQDPMVPPRNGAELHALVPGARMVWIEQSSHFAHVDTPERVVDEVLPFLQGEG
jgi:pimeloyl-ACP methyl ester carboxylesterase